MNAEERRNLYDFCRHHQYILKLVDIAIRVPPLYLMDSILLNNLGIWSGLTLVDSAPPISGLPTNITEEIQKSEDLYQTFTDLYGANPVYLVVPYLARFLLCVVLYALAVLLFFLQMGPLLTFYRYLICLTIIPASYVGHKFMSDSLQGKEAVPPVDLSLFSGYIAQQVPLSWRLIAVNYLFQSGLASVLSGLVSVERGLLVRWGKPYLAKGMVLPCALALVGIPHRYLAMSAFVANILPAALVGTSLGQQAGKTMAALQRMFNLQRDFVNNFGLYTYLEAEWLRLRVPQVFRSFWMSRVILVLLVQDVEVSFLGIYEAFRITMMRGSETIVSLLGMTSIISSISHSVGLVFQAILQSEDDEEKSVASVSAILFFVLALQTGITGLDSEKRFQQLCRNLCLLLSAILHFVHSMVQPLLHNLSATRGNRRDKHYRALGVCLFLLIFPVGLMYFLWSHFVLGTWLLAVSAFCVEVIVKVLVTVTIYGLFMWDVYFQDSMWEGLDDWVYYIRSFGNSVEFCFAVFLFFNGGWILLFESGGTIRAVMMLVHAYFNIWCEAKSGWSTFMKRRTAVAKINSLADATQEDIQKHADVCAICYQEMAHAKLTRCNHMFHAICLRKWLYMQDSCPMCHKLLHKIDATSQTEDIAANRAAAAANNAPVNAARDRPPVVPEEDDSDAYTTEEEETDYAVDTD